MMINLQCHCELKVIGVFEICQKLAIVIVLGSEEDKKTFPTFHFMKSKLCNHLTTHFDLGIKMYAQRNYKFKTFPFYILQFESGRKRNCIMETGKDMVVLIW